MIPAGTWGAETSHLFLLKTGKLMSIPGYFVFNLDTGVKTPVFRPRINNVPVTLICSGHTHLSNGKLLFAGGGDDVPGEHVGHPHVFTFDPDNLPPAEPWERMDDMPIDPNGPLQQGRWYATATALGSGKVLLIAGRETQDDDIPVFDDVPAIFDPSIAPTFGQWTRLDDAALKVVHYYPFTFQVSTGKVFMGGGRAFNPNGVADPDVHRYTYMLDTALAQWGGKIGLGPYPANDEIMPAAAAVMYRPDWVVKSGGKTPDTNPPMAEWQAFAIDLSASNPRWREMNDMIKKRYYHELVALPDGRMLAMGGVEGNVRTQAVPVLEPEWLDPTETFSNVLTADWALLAPMDALNPRRKHSVTLLLPDARLFVAGGKNPQAPPPPILKTAQIFRPPYLYTAENPPRYIGDPGVNVRPEIDSVPPVIYYGQSFTITTPQAPDITKVCLIALGATTHWFNMNQRYVPLNFTATLGGVIAAAPAQWNLAPPGYYMLFILNDGRPGIEYPSEAEIVQLTIQPF